MRYMYATLIAMAAVTGCSDSPSPVADNHQAPEQTEIWMVQTADGQFEQVFSEDDAYALMANMPVENHQRANGQKALSLNLLKARMDGDPQVGGNGVDNFVEEREGPIECWHWTHDEGTWWARHCGFTLSEECYYFNGPMGELRDCSEVGGGPGGNW